MFNKKGSIAFDAVILIVAAMLVLGFLALWKYGINLVTTPLLSVPDTNGISVANATASSLGIYNTALGKLPMIAFSIFLGMLLTIFIGAYFTKLHPLFFILVIITTIFGVILAAQVSNTYEDLLGHGTLGTTFQEFSAMNFIMLNLPVIIAAVGILAGIIGVIGWANLRNSSMAGDIV